MIELLTETKQVVEHTLDRRAITLIITWMTYTTITIRGGTSHRFDSRRLARVLWSTRGV